MTHDASYIKQRIWPQFQVAGEFVSAQPCGSGHIHDTYIVCGLQGKPGYIFQRISTAIFTDPQTLMDNIVRVTEHIRAKYKAMSKDDISRRVLTVIPTMQGKYYFVDEQKCCWRVYLFIEKARTYDVLESLDQAFQVARAFGEFQALLSDLPEPPLLETIPDFHHGPKRFQAFLQALKDDSHNRAKSIKLEIKFLENQSVIFDQLISLIDEGKIPLRVTHNDTKINNVMVDDDTGEALCVIDLDTVMPGSILYDFGDLVRTSTTSAAEDEADLSKVAMEMPRFETIIRGYLSTAGIFLNKCEEQNLILGGKYITLIMGTRFLTDYLNGDIYYKVLRKGHNLDRARMQFKLVQSIHDQEDKMLSLMEKYISRDDE